MNRGFLVGAERSGTTLLRLMLAHHPELSWIPEFTFALDNLPENSDAAAMGEAAEALSQQIDSAEFIAALGISIDHARPYDELIDHLLQQVQDREQTALVGATIHRRFDQLVRLWPEARYIHLVRDGRDVARSRIGMGWAGNVWTSAPVWVETERAWDRARRALADEQVLDVRFEELVAEPQAVLQRICVFLGVGYDVAMLRYSEDATYDRPKARLANQWRRRLGSRDIRRVESVQAEMLVKRGYALSGEPPLKLGGFERALLRAQCRIARAQHRMKLLGPTIYLADALQRRCPLPAAIEDVIDRRRYALERKFVK